MLDVPSVIAAIQAGGARMPDASRRGWLAIPLDALLEAGADGTAIARWLDDNGGTVERRRAVPAVGADGEAPLAYDCLEFPAAALHAAG